MRHALRRVSLEFVAVDLLCPAAERGVGVTLDRTAGQPEHGGPLLNLFVQVLNVKDLVCGAVEYLHLWSVARVTGVCRIHHRFPLSTSLDDLALRARIIPHSVAVSREATESHARKRAPGGEHVWVAPQQNVRHHGTAADASGEDAVGIGIVFLDNVFDHAHYALTVPSTLVSERLGARDIPTLVGLMRGVGVDDNEPVLVGEGGVLGAGEGIACFSVTPMGIHEDWRSIGEFGREIDVETDVGGVIPEVDSHMLKLVCSSRDQSKW